MKHTSLKNKKNLKIISMVICLLIFTIALTQQHPLEAFSSQFGRHNNTEEMHNKVLSQSYESCSDIIPVYNSVYDMKWDSSLCEGSIAETLGYYKAGDHGSALYRITKSVPESYYEEMQNSLYAEMLFDEYVTPEMFGAKADGKSDDQPSIQKAIDSGYPVVLQNDYIISKPVEINTTCTFDGNNKTLTASNHFNGECIAHIAGATGTRMTFAKNLVVNCAGKSIDGIFLNNKRVTLENCVVRFCGRNAYRLENCGGSHILNCSASNNGSALDSKQFKNSVAIKNDSGDVYVDNFDFIDFHSGIEHRKAIGFYSNVHGFVLRHLDDIWEGSSFFKTVSTSMTYAVTLTNAYPDSQQFGFDLSGNGAVNIVGGTSYINSAVWDNTKRSNENTFILKRTGNIRVNFIGYSFNGAGKDQPSIYLAQGNSFGLVSCTDCHFNNVIDNVTKIGLNAPLFSTREYLEESLKSLNENLFHLRLEFVFIPSEEADIINIVGKQDENKMICVAEIPNGAPAFASENVSVQRLNACYFEDLDSSGQVFPLIAYIINSRIYIQPWENDERLFDVDSPNEYVVVVDDIFAVENSAF